MYTRVILQFSSFKNQSRRTLILAVEVQHKKKLLIIDRSKTLIIDHNSD